MPTEKNSTYQSLKDIFPQQLFLTKKETAKVLGISESSVLNYMNSSFLQYTRYGTGKKSSVRISLQHLSIFIDELSSTSKES